MPHSDPGLLIAVVDYLERIAMEPMPENDVVGQVRVSIRRSMGTTTCNLTSIAQLFHRHPRKLQRQLAAGGVTFKQLLWEIRMESARNLLEKSNTEVVKLSRLLGYKNPGAFSKAFSKTHGISADRWRKKFVKAGNKEDIRQRK